MEQTTERAGDQPCVIEGASQLLATPRQDQRYPDLASWPACEGASGSQPRSLIYALGSVEPRFPNVAVEKEYAQVAGRADLDGLTDRQLLYSILSKRNNRYLARQLCWVFTIEGLDTYVLWPRDICDFDLLVEAIRPAQNVDDVDVVIGERGPVAAPEMCNGLEVPIVLFDSLHSFAPAGLIREIQKPTNVPERDFAAATRQLLDRIAQMSDNLGDTEEHRALNYCVVRHPKMYENDNRLLWNNSLLSAVEVRPSRLNGRRRIVDVVLTYTNRKTDFVEKYFTRVDVTEEFPFLVTAISPYYDR